MLVGVSVGMNVGAVVAVTAGVGVLVKVRVFVGAGVFVRVGVLVFVRVGVVVGVGAGQSRALHGVGVRVAVGLARTIRERFLPPAVSARAGLPNITTPNAVKLNKDKANTKIFTKPARLME